MAAHLRKLQKQARQRRRLLLAHDKLRGLDAKIAEVRSRSLAPGPQLWCSNCTCAACAGVAAEQAGAQEEDAATT